MTLFNTQLPAKIQPEQLVALVDTREQLALDLASLRTEVASLPTGDYSLAGLEKVVAVERKSEPDSLCCVGRERSRFDAEVQRLLGYPHRVLVIESTWQRLEQGGWRSQVKPDAVIGSLLGWSAGGLPIVMADDHETAGRYVACVLYTVARRHWRKARALARTVFEPEEKIT